MSDRAKTLAERFERVMDEMIAVVDGAAERWSATCSGEGWSVGVVAHHIATSNEPVAGLVQTVANGQPVPQLTMEMIDQGNAQHAAEYANCTKNETVELLRRSGRAAAEMLRGLSDEQLDRTATMPAFGGRAVSAEQIAEMILIGHAENHLASIRAAL